MSSQYIRYPSSSSGGVSSINSLTGAITLAAGSGISITPSGNTLTIATTSGVTFPLLAPDGSNTAPSYSFAAEITTGLFRPSGSALGVTVNTVQTFQFNMASTDSSFPLRVNNGSSVSPSLTFINDSDNGLYLFGVNSLGFVTAGIDAGHINASQNWILNKQIQTGSGTSGGYFFSAEPTTGMFLGGTHAIDFNSNGNGQIRISDSSVSFLNTGSVFLLPDGAAATPSNSFLNAQTTGLYLFSANSLGFSANGTTAGHIDSSQNWTIPGGVNMGSFVQFKTTTVSSNYIIT